MDSTEPYSEYYINTPGEENKINLERSKFIDEIINLNPQDWNRKIPNNSVLAQSDDLQLHRLRTYAYWEIATNLKIPFLPDFIRIPILTGYNARIKNNIRILIQNCIDQSIINELNDGLTNLDSDIIFIPSTLSMFLREIESKSFEDVIDNLRDNFNEHKKQIVKWESTMRSSKSIKEKIVIKNEIKATLAALKPQNKTEIGLNSSMNIMEDTLSGNLGPQSFATLVKESINQINRWRKRLRMSFFNTSKNEALLLENQNDLLEKSFGNGLTGRQSDRFIQLTQSLYNLVKSDL